MATQDYYDWVKAGRHWTDAKPIADLQKTLQGLGYTVYTIGNDSHLTKSVPEDHTPFSHTGWPGTSPKGRVLALDIMPKNNNMHDLANLARTLIAEKDAGNSAASCIKYINWTDESGNCYHVSWEPTHTTKTSTDKGHIHLSIRTDYVDSNCCAGWNPLAGTSAPPVSAPPASHPAPGPALAFPLPRGYYFGPKSGPDTSVSGVYNRTFNGHTDRYWLEQWGSQLIKRGWSVGQGKAYLHGDGNNGIYGPEYQALIKAFQADQHLSQDGELGVLTWNAAYHNPVT
jgi:peptidoglycan hydrolase-like protein with peptidoglycan-binding domain